MEKTFISFAWPDYALRVSADAISVELQKTEICRLSPHSAVERIWNDGARCRADRDVDNDDFSYQVLEKDGKRIFLWQGSSSNWRVKTYRLECDGEGFSYFVSVEGEGGVGRIGYFDEAAEGDGPRGSRYEFCEYYVPYCEPYGKERNYYPPTMDYRFCYELMVPPMYCYAFRTADVRPWLGLGLVAKPGAYNFTRFDYNFERGFRLSRFHLSTDLEGHTQVNGSWESPAVRGFAGQDEFDVMTQYSKYHFESGLCKRRDFAEIPRWWRGPFLCGWYEQENLAGCTGIKSQMNANQAVYTDIVRRAEEKGLKPTAVFVDDKWQDGYGSARPHPDRWPDLRAFADEMHAKNIRVILWFRLWGGEGLDDAMRMSGDGNKPWNKNDDERYADPSNPAYRDYLRRTIRYLLSDEEGCMNCDGFKLDYALWMPLGRQAVSHSGQYGAELYKSLMQLIFDTAKAVKPDALINASPCHPYFAECCDQVRLHDYPGYRRNIKEVMAQRLRLFHTALPEQLIDTDGIDLTNRRDAMSYFRYAPTIGVPSLYQLSDTPDCTLSHEDWAEVAQIWKTYSEKTDELYR